MKKEMSQECNEMCVCDIMYVCIYNYVDFDKEIFSLVNRMEIIYSVLKIMFPNFFTDSNEKNSL